MYGGDSGEFGTSGSVLGISHAPGYPFISIVLKFFYTIFPFTPQLLANYVSSLAGAVFVLMFLKIADLSGADFYTKIFLFLVTITSNIFIASTTQIEAFIFNSIFLLLLFYSYMKKMPVLFSFIFGVALGNHQTILFSIPFFLPFIFRERRRFIGFILSFIAGFSINTFLIIRAFKNPPVNFQDPDDLRNFIFLILRKEFGTFALHPVYVPFRDIGVVFEQIKAFAFNFFSCVNPFVFLGIFFARNMKYLIMFLLTGVVFQIYSNLSPTSSIAIWRVERFYLMPFVFLLMGVLNIKTPKVLSILPALFVFFTSNFRANFVYRDYAENLSRSFSKNAAVVVGRIYFDEPTSMLLAHMHLLKKRDDLLVLYRPGTMFNTFYGENPLEYDYDERISRQKKLEEEFFSSHKGDLFFMIVDESELGLSGFTPCGVVYSKNCRNLYDFYIRRKLEKPDVPTQILFSHYKYFQFKRGYVPIYEFKNHSWLMYNCGVISFKRGDIKNAMKFAMLAMKDRYFASSYVLAGSIEAFRGDNLKAIEYFDTAIKLSPDSFEARYNKVLCLLNLGKIDAARLELDKMIEMGFKDPRIHELRKILR